VTLPTASEGSRPAWHLYVVRSDRADQLGAALREARRRGPRVLPPTVAPPAPLAVDIELPATDEAARTSLALPIGPTLRAAQVDEVAAAIRATLVP